MKYVVICCLLLLASCSKKSFPISISISIEESVPTDAPEAIRRLISEHSHNVPLLVFEPGLKYRVVKAVPDGKFVKARIYENEKIIAAFKPIFKKNEGTIEVFSSEPVIIKSIPAGWVALEGAEIGRSIPPGEYLLRFQNKNDSLSN